MKQKLRTCCHILWGQRSRAISRVLTACSISFWKLLRESAGEESDEDSILKFMDSQTEVCIFRLEIFLSFWCMLRRETPPTTVPHPLRVQRWGQPSILHISPFKKNSGGQCS